MRISDLVNSTPLDVLMVLVGSTVPGTYVGFAGVRAVDARAQAIAFSAASSGLNLLEPRTTFLRGVFVKSDGTCNANGGYFASGLKRIPPDVTVLKVEQANPGITNSVAYYDINKAFISAVTGVWAAGAEFAKPANAYYFQIGLPIEVIGSAQVVAGAGATFPAYGDANYALAKSGQPWAGKSVAFLGDSILALHVPLTTVTGNLGMTLGLNACLAGRKLQRALFRADDVTPLTASDFTNIDVVYIQPGSNNTTTDQTLGTIADNIATDTVYGNMKRVVEQLLVWKPTIRIFAQTPIYRDDRENNTVSINLVAQAWRDLGEMYGFPVNDMRRESGFNQYTMTVSPPGVLSTDGTHPNKEAGRARHVAGIVGFFNRFPPDQY